MEKIREYKLDDTLTNEVYEVSLDEIAEGLPKVIRESIKKKWKEEFTEWGERIILDKAKDEPIWRLELYCQNGAIIPSEVMQEDLTPSSLATAYSDCTKRLGYCISFYHHQKEYEEDMEFIKRATF